MQPAASQFSPLYTARYLRDIYIDSQLILIGYAIEAINIGHFHYFTYYGYAAS